MNAKILLLHLLAPVVVVAILGSTAQAGTVNGHITQEDGSPEANAFVELWDKDPNPDDFMGSTFTDLKGNYSISYSSKKRWEGIWKNKPDPYIKVRVSLLDVRGAAAFDPNAMVWKSQRLKNVSPTSTKTINLVTRRYCEKKAFGCRGACPTKCSGTVFLWIGYCLPCSDLGVIDLSKLTDDEIQELADAGYCIPSDLLGDQP